MDKELENWPLSIPPIEHFSHVNAGRRNCMVYCLGDRGFYAEVTTVARAMIYAWHHGLQLLLDSADSPWAYDQGWTDYFLPFCDEPGAVDHRRIRERIRFRHDGDKTDFNRLRGFMPEALDFGPLTIRGFQDILSFFCRMIFRPQPECQAVIDAFSSALELPGNYDAIHIRRGDKVGDEDVFYPVGDYLESLLPLHHGETLFVMSDSWKAVDEVRDHLRRQGTDVRLVSLAQPDRTGFDVWKLRRGEPFIGDGSHRQEEAHRRMDVRDKTYELIAETVIAAGARRFVSTWLSNVGRMVWYLHPNRENTVLLTRPS